MKLGNPHIARIPGELLLRVGSYLNFADRIFFRAASKQHVLFKLGGVRPKSGERRTYRRNYLAKEAFKTRKSVTQTRCGLGMTINWSQSYIACTCCGSLKPEQSFDADNRRFPGWQNLSQLPTVRIKPSKSRRRSAASTATSLLTTMNPAGALWLTEGQWLCALDAKRSLRTLAESVLQQWKSRAYGE
jgi:hypothetical protein